MKYIGSTVVRIAIVVVFFVLMPRVYASPFSDVPPGHLHETAISYLRDNGIITGFHDGLFRPDAIVTRAEILKIAMEGADISIPNGDPDYVDQFADVPPSHSLAHYIYIARYRNFVDGYDGNIFNPDQPVSRGEATKILLRVNSIEPTEPYIQPFADTPPELDLTKYIEYTRGKNLVSVSDTVFRINEGMTRGDIAEMMFRLLMVQEQKLDRYPDTGVVPTPRPVRRVSTPVAPVTAPATVTYRPKPDPEPEPNYTNPLTRNKHLSGSDLRAMRTQLFRLINEDRDRNFKDSVAIDSQLTSMAQAYSDDMVRRDFFAHTDPDGLFVTDRAEQFGIEGVVGENIAFAPTIEEIHEGLMRSASHRETILNEQYTRIGIGLTVHDDGTLYVTEHFAPDPPKVITASEITSIRKKLLAEINTARTEEEAPLLVMYDWIQDDFQTYYQSRPDVNQGSLTERYRDQSNRVQAITERRYTTVDAIAPAFVRENRVEIVNPDWKSVSIAVAINEHNEYNVSIVLVDRVE